jgi:hypothetical protein
MILPSLRARPPLGRERLLNCSQIMSRCRPSVPLDGIGPNEVGIIGQLTLYAWTSYIMSTVIQLPPG